MQLININYSGDLQLRIDIYLSENLSIPRNQVQNWIAQNKIKVNDKVVLKSYKLRFGDKITLEPIEFEQPDVNIADCDIKVVYEDKDVVVVEKPAGIVVHPGAAKEKISVVGALFYRGINLSDIGTPLRPGVVHRIDKDTSGIIVLAKNNNAHFNLANQFAQHTVKRYYLGVCEGHLASLSGIIETEIGRHPKNRKEFTVTNGKHAITRYKVIMRLSNMDVVKFELKTGRTHQIRVHMKHLGHPLVGDVIYSKSQSKLINRQALHAFYLGFTHPSTSNVLNFYSKLPKDIRTLLNI